MRGRSIVVVLAVLAAIVASAFVSWSSLRHSQPSAAQPTISREPAPAREVAAAARAVATRQSVAESADGAAPSDGEDSVAADPVPNGWPVSPDGVVLHVIDVVTKNELEDVTLLLRDRDDPSAALHPGPVESRHVLVEHARSPLRVVPRILDQIVQLTSDFWVGAPGHAWIDLQVAFFIEEDRFVELLPAAALVVDVQGPLPEPREPDDAPKLRLRRPPSRIDPLGDLIAELPAQLGETRIDGLAPGPLVASVEVGWAYDSPLVAGSVAAKLVEQQTTHVPLLLAPVERPEPVPFAGTLFVPDGWPTFRFELVIRPVDLVGQVKSDFATIALEKMPEIADRPGWRRWSAGRLHPATYRCEVRTAGFARAIRVAPPGDEPVELILPEPATLRVRVVDVASGEPLALPDMSWNVGRDADRPRMWICMERALDDRSFEALVPAGAGAVETSDFIWILEDESAHAVVHAGSQELIVRAHKACGLVLQYTRDGEPVEPPADVCFAATLEAIGHDGRAPNQMNESGAGTTLYVTRPGRYRVTIPQPLGYAPIAPFEIELPAATLVTRVIELKRP